MQLDQTRVVIRERGWLDILDLALGMLRTRGLPILFWLLVGVLPWALLNHFLILAAQDDILFEASGLYMVYQAMLVTLEMPLATAPLTVYLGQLLFVDRPRPRTILVNSLRSLPQLILFQVICRGTLIFFIFTSFVPFALWPFLNEIILLERNPLWARRTGEISTWRRSSSLHAGMSGDLFARGCGALLLAILLSAMVAGSLRYLGSVLGAEDLTAKWYYVVQLPLAIWLVCGYLTVVRFLNYLDLRIRREGWEVELGLRAEALRLAKQIA